MHPRTPLFASVLTVFALALGACGSDDDENPSGTGGASGGDSGAQQAGNSGACVDSWNKASKDVRAQASLSHRGDGADVQIGTYTGKAFSSTGEAYDSSGSSTSADVSVAPGDCVAVDLTGGEKETNWVMVSVKGGAGTPAGWYFLDETGSHPLAKVPQPLGEPVKATIAGFGVEAKLTPAP
jgi:hypothetical protein